MPGQIKKVLIIGAGPVGLLSALMLGSKGIAVDILEAESYVDTRPRGIAYGPAAVKVLRQAGVLDKIVEQGFHYKDFSWRGIDGAPLVIGDSISGGGEEQTVVLPVGQLSVLLLKEVQKLPNIAVQWDHQVVDIGQNNNQAWAEVHTKGGADAKFTADFIIGADGGTSKVRKIISGGEFPGFTWPLSMVAVNIHYDFEKHGWSDIQWIFDPNDWALVSRLEKDKRGLWRIAYGEKQDASFEEITARAPSKIQRILPDHPSLESLKLGDIAQYRINQRLANHMAVGRVLLAGDAAHLTNPMGGLGLTTGICDVGSLVDSLLHIHAGGSLDILAKYDEARRTVFDKITSPTATANLKRLMQRPEDVDGFDGTLKTLRAANEDPAIAGTLYQHALSIGTDVTALLAV